MLLAMTTEDSIDSADFKVFSAAECLKESLDKYPFEPGERTKVQLVVQQDFYIVGLDTFFTFVIFNLIKNSLYAIREKGSGKIQLQVHYGRIEIFDSGQGIKESVLPHIFENFYTTKSRSTNAGVGLAFCRRVIESFGGRIICTSEYGAGTNFILQFYPKSGRRRSKLPGWRNISQYLQ